MVYNTSIELTYHKYKDDASDAIYRKELLSVFNMEEFDLETINKKMSVLFHSIYIDDELEKKCKDNAARLLSEDLVTGFMLCFSHDTFHETHKYICEKMEQHRRFSEHMMNKY